jgi:hypothetical protein
VEHSLQQIFCPFFRIEDEQGQDIIEALLPGYTALMTSYRSTECTNVPKPSESSPLLLLFNMRDEPGFFYKADVNNDLDYGLRHLQLIIAFIQLSLLRNVTFFDSTTTSTTSTSHPLHVC